MQMVSGNLLETIQSTLIPTQKKLMAKKKQMNSGDLIKMNTLNSIILLMENITEWTKMITGH